MGHLISVGIINDFLPTQEPVAQPLVRSVCAHAIVWRRSDHPMKPRFNLNRPNRLRVPTIREAPCSNSRRQTAVVAHSTTLDYGQTIDGWGPQSSLSPKPRGVRKLGSVRPRTLIREIT